MNVGFLRKLIADLPDEMPVLVRWNDDRCCHVSEALPATVETGCTESPALMIDPDMDGAEDG